MRRLVYILITFGVLAMAAVVAGFSWWRFYVAIDTGMSDAEMWQNIILMVAAVVLFGLAGFAADEIGSGGSLKLKLPSLKLGKKAKAAPKPKKPKAAAKPDA